MNYDSLKEVVLKRLENDLSDKLYYHSVRHTRDVLHVCEIRAKELALSKEKRTLLFSAAVLHDAGFLNVFKEHEKEGVKIAQALLPEYGYNESQIAQVAGMIMATKIPQQAQNQLERILCDADLDYLGRDDFYLIGNTLFQELSELGMVSTEEDWDALQIKFLSNHTYHTDISIRDRQGEKLLRLKELKEKWKVG